MNVKKLLVNVFKRILGFFPTKLPQGMTEFNTWSDSIIEVYQPKADKRSVKFVLSALLMRLGPVECRKSNRYFSLSLQRGAIGEVAAHIMKQMKDEQQAEFEASQKAAIEAKKLEATTEPQAASNVIALSNPKV